MHFILFLLFLLYSSFSWGYEFAIATLFRNSAPYLKEWIEYHKLAGVDHFYLYDNGSSDDFLEILSPYIEEGLVELFDYSPAEDVNFDLACGHRPYQQKANIDACIRASGKARWLALIDLDEFIVPMNNETLPECMNTHFSDAAAVQVSWRCFGTSKKTIPFYEPALFELTKCSLKFHPRNAIVKPIIRPECVKSPRVDHSVNLKEGYLYFNGNGEKVEYDQHGHFVQTYHLDKFLRINHYCLRDDYYFWNVRMKITAKRWGGEDTCLEHYENFNRINDYRIINYIKYLNQEKKGSFWAKYLD